MKHLFNNLSEEEKKAILEQHYVNKESLTEQRTQPGRFGGIGQSLTAGVTSLQDKRAGKKIAKDLTKQNAEMFQILGKISSWVNWMTKQINTINPALESLKTEATNIGETHSYFKSIVSTIDNYKKALDGIETLNREIVKNKGSQTPLPGLSFGTQAQPQGGEAPAESNPQTDATTNTPSPEVKTEVK